MLGSWTGPARELPWRTRRALLVAAAWSTRRPAIKDRLTPLDACALSGCCRRCSRACSSYWRRLIDRPWTGLWHHHTTRSGRKRRRWRCCRCFCCRFCCSRSNWLCRGFLHRRCRSRTSGPVRNGSCHRRNLRLFRRNRRLRCRRSCCRLGRQNRGFRSRRTLFRDPSLGLAHSGGSCYWWLHHYVLRRYNRDHRTHRCRTRRRLCHHRSCRGLRGDCRSCRRNDGGRRPGLRHNLARFWARRSGRRRCDCHRRRSSLHRRLCRRWRRRLARRNMALACLCFLFLLFRQDSLHHVARLGDMREIDFWSNCLGSARSGAAHLARPARSMLKVRADLLGFVPLDRARVCFALTQAEFREYVKNLTAFDFHLAREIVNSNLAHPPLFRLCCPKPLVAHSYLMALEGCVTTIIAVLVHPQRHLFVNGVVIMALKSATHLMRRPLRCLSCLLRFRPLAPERCRWRALPPSLHPLPPLPAPLANSRLLLLRLRQ
jgi:hypothetical protein